MKVYLAGPIEALSYESATTWRDRAKLLLQFRKIETIDPMRNKSFLKECDEITTRNYSISAKEIVSRDRRDVMNADVILMNLTSTNNHSVGSFVELGWADMLRKPVIIILEATSHHRNHPFIKEIAYSIVETLDDAIETIVEF
jgi:nucleoside 2-deoxyribosyltransferase